MYWLLTDPHCTRPSAKARTLDRNNKNETMYFIKNTQQSAISIQAGNIQASPELLAWGDGPMHS
jgi:hypothetical protein